jgi:hypothetical protein
MSYVSAPYTARVADGVILSRAARPTIDRGDWAAAGSASSLGWLQVGLMVAVLSCVSFLLSIIAAGAV